MRLQNFWVLINPNLIIKFSFSNGIKTFLVLELCQKSHFDLWTCIWVILIAQLLLRAILISQLFFKSFWPNFNKKQCVIVFTMSKMSFKHKCQVSIYMTVKLLSINCHVSQTNQHNKYCFELITRQLIDSSLNATHIDIWHFWCDRDNNTNCFGSKFKIAWNRS